CARKDYYSNYAMDYW
nr:immunoglobulin heavy chain junction region [Mus musculus]NSM09050.1 immunoglobulin heavy chain junction region [Mus musculus]NSM09219.1 immunoglobulin heavy chain junction region [Mus musculus]